MSVLGRLTAPPRIEVDSATTPARPHSHKVCSMRRSDVSRDALRGPAAAAAGEARAPKHPTRIRRVPCHILSAKLLTAKA